jgi:hypothetical protein|tara:strand:+ start:1349 stop:1633 length:285 start_codon:yes stop_codon:yes gene_type:complete
MQKKDALLKIIEDILPKFHKNFNMPSKSGKGEVNLPLEIIASIIGLILLAMKDNSLLDELQGIHNKVNDILVNHAYSNKIIREYSDNLDRHKFN